VSASVSARSSPLRTATNSSPPIRASTSPSRTCRCIRAATTRSTSSPASCPPASLTRLNPSRSTTRTPIARFGRCRSASTRVRRYVRLARPVNGSWVAAYARCA
jgi:hypothetical protein